MSKRGINLAGFNPSKAGTIGENTTGSELFYGDTQNPSNRTYTPPASTPTQAQPNSLETQIPPDSIPPQTSKKQENISFIVRLSEDQILLIKYLSRKKKISQSKVVAELLDKELLLLSPNDKDFMTNNKDLFI